MTLTDLGKYGVLDDISVDELLDQKRISERTPWDVPIIYGRSKKRLEFVTDTFDPRYKTQKIPINGKTVRLDCIATKVNEMQDGISTELIATQSELVAVYHCNGLGLVIRKYQHGYFNKDTEEYVAEEKEKVKLLLETMPGLRDATCLTLDVYDTMDGRENAKIIADATCVFGIGDDKAITEWFRLDVGDPLRGIGLGSALETAMLKEMRRLGQKLLVLSGVKLSATRWYCSKGYKFYKPSESSGCYLYKGMEGHVMALPLDPSIITGTTKDHIDWSKDDMQPRASPLSNMHSH